MTTKKRILMTAVVPLMLISQLLGASCSTKTPAYVTPPLGKTLTETSSANIPVIVPYLPPIYYQCMSVLPMEIQLAYYSQYGNHAEAEVYTGKTFVFKDLLVDLYMLRELNKGWLWADLTKCPILNLDVAKKLRSGDRVDIVGICAGRDLSQSPGLVFKDCYVLITGSVRLPAPGGAIFSPTY